MEAPRDNLTRTAPFTLERAADTGDGLTLSGYAAVWDTPTRIDSWEGMFDETIVRGAFKRSINAKMPVMQFEHGRHPMVGSMPLGSMSQLREDDKGLYVEARLSDNWLIQPVRDAIRDGAVDGMSFRFQVVREKWDNSGDVPLRTIQEVKLHELGPVVFPAYDSTTCGVRSADVAELFSLPTEDRMALARALVLGEPVQSDTSPHEPPDPPPDEHSGTTDDPSYRERWLVLNVGVLS
jgi:HK97 family phage prohead protease